MKHRRLKIIFRGLVLFSLFSSAAYAQSKKELNKTIIIKDGDTTINGRKFSEVNRDERVALRKEFHELEKQLAERKRVIGLEKHPSESDILIKRIKPGMKMPEGDTARIARSRIERHHPRELKVFDHDSLILSMNADTIIRRFHRRIDDFGDELSALPLGDIRIRTPSSVRELRGVHAEPFRDRLNSQSFSYSYTDKHGISNRMHIRIGEASNDQIKQLLPAGTSSLAVEDLTLFPNFSSGKMTLSFTLQGKGNTSVKVLDSDLKPVFSDQSSGGLYFRQVNMRKNGIYYIHIKQGNASFVRKIIKD